MTCPLNLQLLADTFAVCRLGGDAPIPLWFTTGEFSSITRTPDELSIVCRQDAVPMGIHCERDWRGLRVAGNIPFTVIGVIAQLTAPLAEAGISVFAVSTFDTDYLFVKQETLTRAIAALRVQGFVVEKESRAQTLPG
jgi:hypothetical protein